MQMAEWLPKFNRPLIRTASGAIRVFVLVALLTAAAALQAPRAGAQDLAFFAPLGIEQSFEAARSSLEKVAPYRRAMWVTRWDFRTPEDIQKICYNAASARFTDVLFQVRGTATAFYKSSYEPWAYELTSGNAGSVGKDPGWDPLEVMVREGHKYGLRVHAYMNVLPAWSGKTRPATASNQLLLKHPDWIMKNKAGSAMDPAKWYAFLDPGLPEVRLHLANVFGEVARNYAVDGIHLDYIRYPEEQGDYGYSPVVLAQFKKQTGKTPVSDPVAWKKFRRDQITATVRAISQAAKNARPGVEVTAAIIADTNRRENTCYQPALEWLDEGIVDAIAPMSYTSKMDVFDTYCRTFLADRYKKRVWMGVITDPKKNAPIDAQIRTTADRGFGGVALFCYQDLFQGHKPNAKARKVYEQFVGGRKQVASN